MSYTRPTSDGFCEFCLELIQKIPSGETRWQIKKTSSFKESAMSCELCKVLCGNNKRSARGRRACLPEDKSSCYDIMVYIKNSSRAGDKDRVCSCMLFWHSSCEVNLAIWADEGQAVSAQIVTRPLIRDNPIVQASEFISEWLRHCIQHHDDCLLSKATEEVLDDSDPPVLPERALEIGGDLEAPLVRLVETQNARGRYCALSHCWGDADKRPFKTTNANLRKHLSGLRYDQLPKTFQDAVLVTLRIGMRYLWIDSLCIILDDKDDWHREAEGMGRLYQNATLVLVAAGAKNSTEGLFIESRLNTAPIRLPCKSPSLRTSFFNATVLDASSSKEPTDGPLRSRAWAFQEWHLGRRKVFFMPGGITWNCSMQSLDELSVSTLLSLHEHLPWLALLGGYSGKCLTYTSDRIVAIRGITNEMKKRQKDRFLYGVWEDILLDQLLWATGGADFDLKGGPSLPSWSWASTGQRKYWIRDVLFLFEEPIHIPRAINIGHSGCL